MKFSPETEEIVYRIEGVPSLKAFPEGVPGTSGIKTCLLPEKTDALEKPRLPGAPVSGRKTDR